MNHGSGHRPRKRFGQNFLHDRAVIERIVAAIAPAPDDNIVEIGPGRGALTAPLLDCLGHLHAIEIDRDLIAALRDRWPVNRLTIHAGDALAFDFATLGARVRVVGNLPYNISTPILFHLAASPQPLRDAYFMLQREVVERMVAAPSTPEYGRLSVALQTRFAMDLLFLVPPESFTPVPRVESAIVRLVPRTNVALPAAFDAVITRAFTMRRKTLRNALAGLVPVATLAALGVDPGLRPEALDYQTYQRIAAAV